MIKVHNPTMFLTSVFGGSLNKASHPSDRRTNCPIPGAGKFSLAITVTPCYSSSVLTLNHNISFAFKPGEPRARPRRYIPTWTHGRAATMVFPGKNYNARYKGLTMFFVGYGTLT
jgi:hypothetical protein